MHHAVSPYFFYFFAAASIVPGIFVLATKDIVRAAFWLLFALSGFAGLYVLLGADFLAVTQVVVYLGGILILILFGVMLTHRDPALVRRARRLNIVVPGIGGGAILAAAVAAAMTRAHFAVAAVSIAGIAPNTGATEGGTTVTITGANLNAVSDVKLGGEPLKNLVITDSQITGVTPHHEKEELVAIALVTVAKLAPWSVTLVPPSIGPCDGETEVRLTAATAKCARVVAAARATARTAPPAIPGTTMLSRRALRTSAGSRCVSMTPKRIRMRMPPR